MARIKKNSKSTVTFIWDNLNMTPKVTYKNVSSNNVQDIFALSVENLITKNPQYHKLLHQQLDVIYNYIYGKNTTIN